MAEDLLIRGGEVFLPEGRARVDVASSGGVTTWIGSPADAPEATRTIDAAGKLVLPGLIDPHSHFPGNGVNALYVANVQSPPLGPVNSIDDLVAVLKKKAQETPKGEWIRGAGYDQTLLKEGRHPTRDDLDRATDQLKEVFRR